PTPATLYPPGVDRLLPAGFQPGLDEHAARSCPVRVLSGHGVLRLVCLHHDEPGSELAVLRRSGGDVRQQPPHGRQFDPRLPDLRPGMVAGAERHWCELDMESTTPWGRRLEALSRLPIISGLP